MVTPSFPTCTSRFQQTDEALPVGDCHGVLAFAHAFQELAGHSGRRSGRRRARARLTAGTAVRPRSPAGGPATVHCGPAMHRDRPDFPDTRRAGGGSGPGSGTVRPAGRRPAGGPGQCPGPRRSADGVRTGSGPGLRAGRTPHSRPPGRGRQRAPADCRRPGRLDGANRPARGIGSSGAGARRKSGWSCAPCHTRNPRTRTAPAEGSPPWSCGPPAGHATEARARFQEHPLLLGKHRAARSASTMAGTASSIHSSRGRAVRPTSDRTAPPLPRPTRLWRTRFPAYMVLR